MQYRLKFEGNPRKPGRIQRMLGLGDILEAAADAQPDL